MTAAGNAAWVKHPFLRSYPDCILLYVCLGFSTPGKSMRLWSNAGETVEMQSMPARITFSDSDAATHSSFQLVASHWRGALKAADRVVSFILVSILHPVGGAGTLIVACALIDPQT